MPSLSPYMPYQYIPEKLRQYDMQDFTYDVEWVGNSVLLASAPNQSSQFQIQADSFFLCVALSGTVSATDESAVDATPRVLIQIQDSGSGQALSDVKVDWPNYIGTGQNPCFMPYPRIFQPNATVTVYLRNLIATQKNVRLSFLGFKIYAPLSALAGY